MRPVQAVLREPQIELVHRTIQEDSEVHTEIETVKESRFEIEKGVVIKVTALSYSTSLHFILFTHHHIALDGASWSVFLADLANAYSGRVTSTAMGVDVSLLKTYRSLRRANVVSTRTLCEMAIPRRIPLHYVSTASVAKVIELDNEESLLEVPASPAVPELLNSLDGYASSKWVSEMLLEKVAEDNGLPVFIHRLAHVVGNDASELDAVGMLTKYSLLVGKMPRIKVEDVTGQWDFIMVQDMVRDLIKSAVESAIDGSNPPDLKQQTQGKVLIFMNHCSDMKVLHEKFGKYLEDMAGRSLQDISMTGWLAEASERGLHPLVQEFFAAFDRGRGKMVLPIIANGVK